MSRLRRSVEDCFRQDTGKWYSVYRRFARWSEQE